MADIEDPEHRGSPDLFRLQIRVVWLYRPLPRFKFRSPQAAGIQLVRPHIPPESAFPFEQQEPALSPLEKFTLLRESGERCYWCARDFGSKWAIRGRLRRLRLEWDHVIPESGDGTSDIGNMVPSCNICNGWKSDREFSTEAEIRDFLEEQWTQALAPIVEPPSEPEPTRAVAPDDTADAPVSIVPTAPAKQRKQRWALAHTNMLRIAPADLGPMPSRPLPRGLRVKILSGPMTGHYGITDGPSKDRPTWTRVLVGSTLIPWRFDPRRLQRVEDVAA